MTNQITTFGSTPQTFFDINGKSTISLADGSEKGTLTLRDGDESFELTPQILKRIIEIVKREFPEDQL